MMFMKFLKEGEKYFIVVVFVVEIIKLAFIIKHSISIISNLNL